MYTWVILVVIAQFINAVVAMVDKYIIASKTIPQPLAYTFFVTLLSALSVVIFFFGWVPLPEFIPFDIPSFRNVGIPTLSVVWTSLVAGAALFGALTALFSAFQEADASDIVPVVGASSAIGTLLFSSVALGSTLTENFALGFLLLVGGTLLLSHYRFSWRVAGIAIFSGALFAVHFVCLKDMFVQTHFDNAFFWSRLGIAVVPLVLLIVPRLRRRMLTDCATCTALSGGPLIFTNKVLAGLASILILKGIELGNVSIVQAMGGLQFAFLLFLGVFIGPMLPRECGERTNMRGYAYKTIAVITMISGIFILFL